MKRTTLSSVVMASLMVSTLVAPAVAGHGGGSGGRSFGGGNGGGKSTGGNFAAKSSTSFRPQVQVMQKFNGNVSNVSKVAGGQHFTQKLQQSGNGIAGKSLGISSKNLVGIQNGNFKHSTLKSSQNNWWCSTGSKSCGNWYPGKFCGFNGCYPYFGCYPYSNCYSNYWYPSCYSYPTCGYNYSYYNCSYGPQYCSPVYTTPVVYGTSGVSANASSPVVVNVDAGEANPNASPAKTVAADKLLEMKLGGTYALPGSGFGTKAGQMFVEIGDVALGVKVDDWDDQKVSFTLPMIGLAKATDAKIHLVSSEGQPIKSTPVRLVMPTQTQLTAQQ